MIGLGSPVPRLLPNPDAAFGAADRAFLLYLYAGLALTVASSEIIAGTMYLMQLMLGTATITQNRVGTVWIDQLVTGTVER